MTRGLSEDSPRVDLAALTVGTALLVLWLWWFLTPSVPVYAVGQVLSVGGRSQEELSFEPDGGALRLRRVPRRRLMLGLSSLPGNIRVDDRVRLRLAAWTSDDDPPKLAAQVLDIRHQGEMWLVDLAVDAAGRMPTAKTAVMLRLRQISPAAWLLSGLHHKDL